MAREYQQDGLFRPICLLGPDAWADEQPRGIVVKADQSFSSAIAHEDIDLAVETDKQLAAYAMRVAAALGPDRNLADAKASSRHKWKGAKVERQELAPRVPRLWQTD